jgi:hypothetical protein
VVVCRTSTSTSTAHHAPHRWHEAVETLNPYGGSHRITVMHMALRKAGTVVLAGLVAGSLTLLVASPAGAVGARPSDPSSTPSGTSGVSTAPPSTSASGGWGRSAPSDSSVWF